MGTSCSSTKKRLVVRQTSSLKLSLHQHLHKAITEANGIHKLQKKDSDLNLLPTDSQKNWEFLSDESVFEREKRMVVVLVGCQRDKHSQLVLIDVDCQSANFGKIICQLSLPLPGEELFSFACIRNTHSARDMDDLDHLISQQINQQFTLVVPVPSHSRIYIVNLMDGTISGGKDNGHGHHLGGMPEGPLLSQMRIQKCITRDELARWDLGAPLTICSNNAGRSSAVPLLLVTAVDRAGHCKGDLFRLDRRTFCAVDRRKRSMTEDDRESSVNSGHSSIFAGSPAALCTMRNGGANANANGITSPVAGPTKYPMFGGSLAINLRNGVVFTTEWGNLERIFQEKPTLKQPEMGSQDLLNDNERERPNTIYGSSINVWEIRRRRLVQTIRLDPYEDALMPVCIRMLHHSELTHGFICTAVGSSIFHLHKSTKSGLFMADRVAKFSPAQIDPMGWAGGCADVPAFLTDMAISMNDQYLFVCAAFHGFIAQMNISDPFRPTLIQKVFLGGIICKTLGIVGLGKMPPTGKNGATPRSYNVDSVKVGGRLFEGGPCRLQLSLDGRRLFVSNSFLRNWDQHFFPRLAECGSTIGLVHVDPTGKNPLKLDEEFGIHFDADNEGNKNGGGPTNLPNSSPFYAREMRFLGGDSTADFV